MSNTRNVPNCSDFKTRVGDKGQRYEIRYVDNNGNEKPFGWASTLEGALNMRDAATLAAWCRSASVVDRDADGKVVG